MNEQFEHFELQKWQEPLSRRKKGGSSTYTRPNKREHGELLLNQTQNLSNKLQERLQRATVGINPKLIFKIKINAGGNVDEDQLRRMGLHVLAFESKKALVVFPDTATLNDMQTRIRSYAGIDQGPKYDFMASIDEIVELQPEDRIGKRLQLNPLTEDETTFLDIELWHTGDPGECRAKKDEIQQFLSSSGLIITDWYIGQSLCLLRAKINKPLCDILLNLDYIKEIDRRPAPSFEMLDLIKLDISQLNVPDISTDELSQLVGVLIIDSGIMTGHPLIRAAVGDAQIFPDRLRERVQGGPEDGDEKTNGHGTAVAGIAIYNDVGEAINNRTFIPSASIFSARVTDNNNEYDLEELLEHQFQKAIEYFLSNYPSVKVINISLGDDRLVYSDGSYQFRLAAAIDEMAYKYRDHEIVFVISSGNFWPRNISDENILQQYPSYLLTDNNSRLIDPATAAIPLTVGGICYGEGRIAEQDNSTDRVVAGARGWPFPFTRTGWGADGAIKPDVVDFAGDGKFVRGRILDETPQNAGIPTTAKDFAPPNGRLFRTVMGTSFAAPRVANLAARLYKEFPSASSNMIRALIANSARIPTDKPEVLADKKMWDDEILRIYGYGQPDFEFARWSSENRVLLLAEGSLELDSFQLYSLPSLPREFLTQPGKGYFSVVLAYDPPTRHTRADSYLGISMEFALFRNTTAEQVREAIRDWNKEEKDALEDKAKIPSKSSFISSETVKLYPGVNRRKKGTLQKAVAVISGTRWTYNDSPLILAVICQRNWAPVDIVNQRYALIASLQHDNDGVRLYTHIRQQARIYQRIRARV